MATVRSALDSMEKIQSAIIEIKAKLTADNPELTDDDLLDVVDEFTHLASDQEAMQRFNSYDQDVKDSIVKRSYAV